MQALVTGSRGFIARNLINELQKHLDVVVLTHNRSDSDKDLLKKLEKSEIIFHLAGVNRSDLDQDFQDSNVSLTARIIEHLEISENRAPIIFSSSSQAGNNSIYGQTKIQAENLLKAHNTRTLAGVRIYRLLNVFGRHSRPDYNSVVATFCYRVVNGLEISMPNPDAPLKLVPVEAVVDAFVNELCFNNKQGIFKNVEPVYETTVGKVLEMIKNFYENDSRQLGKVGSGLDFYLKLAFDYFHDQSRSSRQI